MPREGAGTEARLRWLKGKWEASKGTQRSATPPGSGAREGEKPNRDTNRFFQNDTQVLTCLNAERKGPARKEDSAGSKTTESGFPSQSILQVQKPGKQFTLARHKERDRHKHT